MIWLIWFKLFLKIKKNQQIKYRLDKNGIETQEIKKNIKQQKEKQ